MTSFHYTPLIYPSIWPRKEERIKTLRKRKKIFYFAHVMYGCESWTVKKAERRRINAFKLWCWTRLLRVPWTARRSNQSILKEISPEYPLEGLMKMKRQYFGHLMRRVDSLEKTLMLGGIGKERKVAQSCPTLCNPMDCSLPGSSVLGIF